MAQHSRRFARGLAAAALLSPTLAACGFNPQTNQVYQPGVGSNFRTSQVDVLNAIIVTSEGGGSEGRLIASFVNNETGSGDAVTDIAGAGADSSLQVGFDSEIELTAGNLVNLADSEKILVTGIDLVPGQFVDLRYTFSEAEAVTFPAVVVSDYEEGPYADLGPDSSAEAVDVEVPPVEGGSSSGGEVGSGGDLGTAPADSSDSSSEG